MNCANIHCAHILYTLVVPTSGPASVTNNIYYKTSQVGVLSSIANLQVGRQHQDYYYVAIIFCITTLVILPLL